MASGPVAVRSTLPKHEATTSTIQTVGETSTQPPCTGVSTQLLEIVHSTNSSIGPTAATDAYWRATAGKAVRRTDFASSYHTFGLEWSKNYLFTYLDFELQQVLYWSFEGTWDMWARGYFSSQTANGSLIQDPWAISANVNAPFDRNFYLIMNVAVGSRNGWFRDGIPGKPWVDAGATAVGDFYNAADKWLPTWGAGTDSAMNVKSVKMWQEGACGSPSPA